MTELDERFLARGKRVDNGEWIEGYYGEYYNGEKYVSCISIPSKETISGSLCYEIVKETLGHYSGLRDKNDKRIFEGDTFSKGKLRNVVELCNGEFCINGDSPLWCFKNRTVIGNIHDNP